MTLRKKLLLAQGPLVLAVIVLGVTAIFANNSLARRADDILRANYRSALAMQRIKEATERIDSALLFLLVGHSNVSLSQIKENKPTIDSELLIEEGNITEEGEREQASALRRAWNKYQSQITSFMEAPSSDHYFQQIIPLFVEIKQHADAILNTNQDAMQRKSNKAQQTAQQLNALMISVALLSLLSGLGLSSLFTGRMLRPLAMLRQITQRIGSGDYEVKADPSGQDEIAQLSNDFNVMAARLREYKKSSVGELLHAQRASQAAIESLPEPVVIYDLSGKILANNYAAANLLQTEQEETKPLRESLEKISSHVLRGKGPYTPKGFEEALRVNLHEERFLLPRANPIYGEDNSVLGVTVLLQDVTRLRHFDELKNDLVATVAHEFRTPLTSLRMAIHLCIEQVAGPLSAKQAELLHAAREDTERLQGLVDELLDLARIQAGRFTLHTQTLDPEAIANTALEPFQSLVQERKIEIKKSFAPMLPHVTADQERIQIVLSNLLSNALRYTKDSGTITVSLAQTESNHIRFAVRDEGPGIPKELHAAIFEKFKQLSGDNPGATGLGLFLAKEIIKAHNGDIGVASDPGHGAELWFTLPI